MAHIFFQIVVLAFNSTFAAQSEGSRINGISLEFTKNIGKLKYFYSQKSIELSIEREKKLINDPLFFSRSPARNMARSLPETGEAKTASTYSVSIFDRKKNVAFPL